MFQQSCNNSVSVVDVGMYTKRYYIPHIYGSNTICVIHANFFIRSIHCVRIGGFINRIHIDDRRPNIYGTHCYISNSCDRILVDVVCLRYNHERFVHGSELNTLTNRKNMNLFVNVSVFVITFIVSFAISYNLLCLLFGFGIR